MPAANARLRVSIRHKQMTFGKAWMKDCLTLWGFLLYMYSSGFPSRKVLAVRVQFRSWSCLKFPSIMTIHAHWEVLPPPRTYKNLNLIVLPSWGDKQPSLASVHHTVCVNALLWFQFRCIIATEAHKTWFLSLSTLPSRGGGSSFLSILVLLLACLLPYFITVK